jgi:hypothetical protein
MTIEKLTTDEMINNNICPLCEQPNVNTAGDYFCQSCLSEPASSTHHDEPTGFTSIDDIPF